MVSSHDFILANRAFNLFTLHEREQALTIFASLEYPSTQDRFFEAVYAVIMIKSPRPLAPQNEP